jgi:hypothetical protein
MFCVQLYALFKVANGEDITKAPAPGMFDLKVCSLTYSSSLASAHLCSPSRDFDLCASLAPDLLY